MFQPFRLWAHPRFQAAVRRFFVRALRPCLQLGLMFFLLRMALLTLLAPEVALANDKVVAMVFDYLYLATAVLALVSESRAYFKEVWPLRHEIVAAGGSRSTS